MNINDSNILYRRVKISDKDFVTETLATTIKLVRVKNAQGFVGTLGHVQEVASRCILFLDSNRRYNIAVTNIDGSYIELDVIDIKRQYLLDALAKIRRHPEPEEDSDKNTSGIYVKENPRLEVLFDTIHSVSKTGADWSDTAMTAITQQLLTELVQLNAIPFWSPFLNEARIVDRVVELVATELGKRWKIEDVAHRLNMSKAKLQRKLKENSTEFSKLVSFTRLDYARKMLMHTELSISQIADRCGFESHAYFSNLFKKRYGMSPRELKRYS